MDVEGSEVLVQKVFGSRYRTDTGLRSDYSRTIPTRISTSLEKNYFEIKASRSFWVDPQ